MQGLLENKEIEELKTKIETLEERIRSRRILEKDRDYLQISRPVMSVTTVKSGNKLTSKSKSVAMLKSNRTKRKKRDFSKINTSEKLISRNK